MKISIPKDKIKLDIYKMIRIKCVKNKNSRYAMMMVVIVTAGVAMVTAGFITVGCYDSSLIPLVTVNSYYPSQHSMA